MLINCFNNSILYWCIILFRLINDLEFFKVRNKAIAPFVYSRITNLQAFLSLGKRNPLISNEIIQVLSEVINNIDPYIPLFAKAFTLAYKKCEKYIC